MPPALYIVLVFLVLFLLGTIYTIIFPRRFFRGYWSFVERVVYFGQDLDYLRNSPLKIFAPPKEKVAGKGSIWGIRILGTMFVVVTLLLIYVIVFGFWFPDLFLFPFVD